MTRRFVLLLLAVAAIVLLWSGAWYFGAVFLRGEIAALADRTPSVACTRLDIGGYPFRYDLTCTEARLDRDDLSASLAEIRASVLVYMPTHVLVFAKSPARIEDAFSGASYRLDWDNLEASVRLDWTALARASLVANGLVFSDTVLDRTEIARLKHAEAHVLGTEGAIGKDNRNLRLLVAIEDAVLPLAEAPVEVEATALLTEWPADIRRWSGRDLLADWALGGGEVHITKAGIVSGDLSAGLTGTLAPDRQGLIDGSLLLTSKGLAPMMRKFFAAPLAGAVLGPEDEDGNTSQTLVFSHSIMRAGIVPLFEVPPLF